MRWGSLGEVGRTVSVSRSKRGAIDVADLSRLCLLPLVSLGICSGSAGTPRPTSEAPCKSVQFPSSCSRGQVP